jgi:ATP-dependent DNA helicase PIF1
MTQDQALKILSTGANVFLTGEPGSGKTHTVNAYVALLNTHGIEPAITASTGIASTHIHGMTIHSWSGIGIKESLSGADLDSITTKEYLVKRIQKTKVLIIDEVSMLSAKTLSMVDEVCREIKKNSFPFGGIQVILVGDFFQLPPIARRGGEAVGFAFESSVWQKLNPIICYLTEQHRQEDARFLSVLSAIRLGESDATTVSTITSRETELDGIEEDIPRLYTHNVDVDKMNQEKLGKLTATSKSYRMEGEGAPLMIEALKRGCLSPEQLILKEGAIVMGTKNNPLLGLMNGTLATVIGFERGTNYPLIETHEGRRITVAPMEWAVEEQGKVRAKITQIPLRLAWAITIHKSQGMSMDAAAIDLSRTFEYGQGYVALSRVRTLAGLHILGWSEQALLVHPAVLAQDTQMRESSDSAEESFSDLEKNGELIPLQENFIRACGGTVKKKTIEDVKKESEIKKKKSDNKKNGITTFDETLELLKNGKSLKEISRERSLTFGTICTHVEKLHGAGKISVEVLRESIDTSLSRGLEEINAVFKATGTDTLTPAFSELNGVYSYDELKIARILYNT